MRGGLTVHLGCGDGRLTAALHAATGGLVQGLDPAPQRVQEARRHMRERGLYGPVSAAQWAGPALPYADNTVNLLLADAPDMAARSEIDRVLRPGGVALLRNDAAWHRIEKAWPPEIDHWTHFLHGPDNNPVADDSRVGPPRRVQWLCGPRWSRSHETDRSVIAMVSAAGRLIHMVDRGPTGYATRSGVPGQWYLEARDAFSGVLLWRTPARDWPEMGIWGCTYLSRRLVADADRAYVTLGFTEPVTEVDTRTGQLRRTLPGTDGAAEMRLLEGKLVVVRPHEPLPKWGAEAPRPMDLVAFDTTSGEEIWRVATTCRLQTPAARGDQFFYVGEQAVHCLDMADGGEVWRMKLELGEGEVPHLLAQPGVLLVWTGKRALALSAISGEELWSRPGGEVDYSSNSHHLPFVVDGLLNGFVEPRTGRTARTLPEPPRWWQSPGHHRRCFPDKMAGRYILTAKRGIELRDLRDGDFSRNNWVRGICSVGVMPCNGLIYVPPHPCFCYREAKLFGFYALAPQGPEPPADPGPRLVRGPAWPADGQGNDPADWPTYRHDPLRSGSTPSRVPSELAPAWKAEIGGRLSPLTMADGRLYVAQVDAHAVHCLDASSGALLWRFTAGARVDTPPTIHRGLALFGCRDGWVYALRSADGELVWRFRAAPAGRRVVAFDRVESAWPVHGGVLVRDGVAYVSAGRSSFLDGGIHLYALDPMTGQMLHHRHLDGPWPDLEEDSGNGFYMDGALNDLLVAGAGQAAEFIYLRHMKFDRHLNHIPVPPNTGLGPVERGVSYTGEPEKTKVPRAVNQGDRDVGLHLFATSTLLDDTYFDRTGWMFADTWPGYNHINQAPKSGQILAFSDTTTFAFQQFTERMRRSPLALPGQEGFLLVADRNDNEPVLRPEHRNLDKAGPGFTRADPPLWERRVRLRVRAMAVAAGNLFVAGQPDVIDSEDPLAAFEGRKGGLLQAYGAADGTHLHTLKLDSPPVFDGLIAAEGQLFMATQDGGVTCLKAQRQTSIPPHTSAADGKLRASRATAR